MAVVLEDIELAMGERSAHMGGTGAASVSSSAVARLWQPGCVPRVAPKDPAVLLVTDFSRERAWTVTEERSIEDAMGEMVCAGVGSLLVMRADVVTGLVTSYELEGRSTLELLQTTGCASRAEIKVAHVMIPWCHLPVLDWRAISGSRVHQVEAWVRNTRVTHALLVERLESIERVRGLLSRAHIEHSLGRSL